MKEGIHPKYEEVIIRCACGEAVTTRSTNPKGGKEIRVEICSVCNIEAVEKVFRAYQPQIVLHAAAHKHVPLMEKNCVEAVDNNVFGTYNVIKMTEKYKAERFIMISTDKAVNPTNVMGATKRMCEMITQYYSTRNNGALRQRARQRRLRNSAFQASDSGRRSRNDYGQAYKQILYDYPRGVTAGFTVRHHGEERRAVRA